MPEPRTVYVIDDEEAVRDSVMLLLESRGLLYKALHRVRNSSKSRPQSRLDAS